MRAWVARRTRPVCNRGARDRRSRQRDHSGDLRQRHPRARPARPALPRRANAQHLRPQDVPLFGPRRVVASMQPYHAIDDGRWVDSGIGPQRIKTTYAFRTCSIRRHPWPSAPTDRRTAWTPCSAYTRRSHAATLDGKNPGGWVPEQKISVERRCVPTRYGNAWPRSTSRSGERWCQAFADIVVLDRDPFACRPNRSAPSSHASP